MIFINIFLDSFSPEIVDNLEFGMCGRYSLYSNPQQIAKIFNVVQSFQFNPVYNIAPSSIVPVLCELSDHSRVLVPMRWGLIPSWQKEENISSSMINARVETIDQKPAFRNAILKRRCLIIADGFYEWSHGTTKQPFFIHMKNSQPFGIAGIWEKWVSEDEVIDSCAIITLDANNLVSSIHNRMPAIVHSEDYGKWLDNDVQSWELVKNILKPYEDEALEVYPVSPKVNNARYNLPDCIIKKDQ